MQVVVEVGVVVLVSIQSSIGAAAGEAAGEAAAGAAEAASGAAAHQEHGQQQAAEAEMRADVPLTRVQKPTHCRHKKMRDNHGGKRTEILAELEDPKCEARTSNSQACTREPSSRTAKRDGFNQFWV